MTGVECPSCCQYRWRITLAGSRFLNKAEPNYWPVEGEALAVAWALGDTGFFTTGCCNLHIQTDHHPLIKLFGDQTLVEVSNKSLINFLQKSKAWQFQIHYVPGSSIPTSDATSRSPDNCKDTELVDNIDWPNASIALAAI